MKLRYFITLAACLFCIATFAQKKQNTEAEFRAKKQAYMVKRAELTPEESEKFFPLYFEFLDKKKEINQKAWQEVCQKNNPSEMTEMEYEKIIDKFFDNQETIAKLEKEYIKKYREILSAKKVYMLYWAEQKFARNMLKILQKMEDKE